MFSFVALGIETMEPTGADGPSLATNVTRMTFSHDLVPQIGWTLLAGAIAFAVTRRRLLALIAMALSLDHWLGDLIAGYGHQAFGPDSHPIGTDWYHLNLPAALSFEAALGVLCVYVFTRRSSFSTGAPLGFYGPFRVLPFAFLVI